MARRRPLDFGMLRDWIKPIDVLRLTGWEYTSHCGSTFRGPCPIHKSSSTRSRTLSIDERVWYCHKCKRGGDAVELWADLKGVDPLDAAYDLCQLLGICPPYLTRR